MARFIVDGCPKCDFSAGRSTRPILCENGLMRCDTCGSTWRSLGSASVPEVQPPLRGFPVKPSDRPSVSHHHHEPTPVWQSLAGMFAGTRKLFAPAAVIVCAALVSIGFLQFDFARTFRGLAASVEITSVNVRQLQRDGQIAVQVEGRIVNRSKTRMPVGEVSIVLTQAKGHRVFSWKHRPAIAFLEPGQSFRFSTANGSVPELANNVEIRSGDAYSLARI